MIKKFAVFCLFLTTACLSPGSPLESVLSGQFQAEKDAETDLLKLKQRIARADHILATNWATGNPGFSNCISDGRVVKIIKAVSDAKPSGKPARSSIAYDWKFDFFAGTNCLGTIWFNKEAFVAPAEFRDESGVLGDVYQGLVKQEYYSRVYKDEEKAFASATKAEARAWLKVSSHSISKEKGKVIQVVDDFYVSGAVNVYIAGIEKAVKNQGKAGESGNSLVVVLPSSPEARRKVFAVHWRVVPEFGIDADDDVGQKYLWYPFQ